MIWRGPVSRPGSPTQILMTGHAHCHPRIALPKKCDRVVWEPQLNALQISLFEQQGLGMGGRKNTENPADTAKIDTRMNGGAQRGRRTCLACFNSLRPLCLAAHLQGLLACNLKLCRLYKPRAKLGFQSVIIYLHLLSYPVSLNPFLPR